MKTTDFQPNHMQTDIRSLVISAQSGSNEAVVSLQMKFSPLILSMLKSLDTSMLNTQEIEDLREEAVHKLLDAVYSYDATQEEVTFGLYARVCIHNGLVSELRRMTNAHKVTLIPLDDPMLEGIASADDPVGSVTDNERYEQLCKTIRTELSPYENRIWWAYMAGKTVEEIAVSLGKPEKSVYNAVYRIRQKLRICLLKDKT